MSDFPVDFDTPFLPIQRFAVAINASAASVRRKLDACVLHAVKDGKITKIVETPKSIPDLFAALSSRLRCAESRPWPRQARANVGASQERSGSRARTRRAGGLAMTAAIDGEGLPDEERGPGRGRASETENQRRNAGQIARRKPDSKRTFMRLAT
jgi:hypothetical protein